MPADYTERFVKSAVFVLVVGAVVATSLETLMAQGKNKPTTSNAVMTVEFRDELDDRVVSDGGPYVHGVSKVEALVYAASGDLRLDLSSSTVRSMVVHLGNPSNPGAPTNVSYISRQTLYVESIASVPVGTAELRRGRLGLAPSLPGYALGFRYQTSTGVIIDGTELCVYRGAPGYWEISSSSSMCEQDSDMAGLFEDTQKGTKVSHRAVASYNVPFAITATCTANCPH